MEKITCKKLESLVDYLNKITNHPTAYTDGWNVGSYRLDIAYGGYCLEQISNNGGGISQPLGGGYDSAKIAYTKIYSFVRGIEASKQS
jgi:hypothetical protein